MINKNVENDFTNSVRQYYKELKKCPPINAQEQYELLVQAQEGNIQARNKLITANLRFVYDIARRYKGRGVRMADLISEGNLGLIKAIDKFDTTKKNRFITYAVWWIRDAIQTAIEKDNCSAYKEQSLDDLLIDRINEPNSLSTSDDESVSLKESSFPDTHTIELSLTDRRVMEIDNMLSVLGETEKYVINSLYGNKCEPLTFKDLGKKLHVSSERVRQIKANGIKKMRAYALMNEKNDLFF